MYTAPASGTTRSAYAVPWVSGVLLSPALASALCQHTRARVHRNSIAVQPLAVHIMGAGRAASANAADRTVQLWGKPRADFHFC